MANVILNDTDLRRYVEDMGGEHTALRQYILNRLEFNAELRQLVDNTIVQLTAAEQLCDVIDFDKLSTESQDAVAEIGGILHDVSSSWIIMQEDI